MYQYSISELSSGKALVRALHTTGSTVTFELYDGAGVSVPLTSAACTEIATSGVFVFDLDNITTKPTSFENYQGFFKDGVTVVGYIEARAGGWVALIDPAGVNVVTITTEETDTTPIPDVFVKVYNSDQTVLLRTGNTDTNGEIIFNMDDGTYVVVLYKNAVNFSPTESLVVLGPTADTYNGEVLTSPVPAAANVCRVSGFAFVQSSTGAIPSFDGTATITQLPFNIDNIFYEGQKVAATFNAGTGEFYWDLPYNAVVKLNSRNIGIANGVISVPPQAAASLNDLDIR